MHAESHRQVQEAAGAWLARCDADDWTDEDRMRFDQWLNESPLHLVAFLRLEHAWERARRLKSLGAGLKSGGIPSPGNWVLSPFFDDAPSANHSSRPDAGMGSSGSSGMRSTHRRRGEVRRVGAFAAAVLLAMISVLTWYLWPAGSAYRTPVGGTASVPMPDGSLVILNTDSEIRVTVTEVERRVTLDQGEAFFEVARDSRRPFVVLAGDKRIVAVGTRFSVRREDDGVRVVVTEGRVRVETVGQSTQEPAELLASGSVAYAGAAGTVLQKGLPAQAEEILSWRSGLLVFDEVTLADAVEEFNRYNTRKIVIHDADIATMRVAGSFRATNAEAFARLLERGYPLRVERRGKELILRGR